jgi:hypothetical protein
VNITGLGRQKSPSKLVQANKVVLNMAVPGSNLDWDNKSGRFLVYLHANVEVVLQNLITNASTAF